MGKNVQIDALEKALDLGKPVVETACELIKNLLGKPCLAIGLLLEDTIYAWRWRNRIRIAHKASVIMQRDHVAAGVLPPGFLLPLLEKAGDVDDEDLQDIWARLLASGAESETHRHPAFVTVLHQLSHDDTTVLRLVSAQQVKISRPKGVPGKFTWSATVDLDLPKGILSHDEDVAMCIDHLVGLGLLEWRLQTSLHMTAFGDRFLEACTSRSVNTLGVEGS
jgi:hypothetical protein